MTKKGKNSDISRESIKKTCAQTQIGTQEGEKMIPFLLAGLLSWLEGEGKMNDDFLI